MKESRITNVLLIVIGTMSVVASVYLYYKGKPFQTYFSSGIMGLAFTVLGYVNLKKKKTDEENEE